jgi:signal transduction histidine kinase
VNPKQPRGLIPPPRSITSAKKQAAILAISVVALAALRLGQHTDIQDALMARLTILVVAFTSWTLPSRLALAAWLLAVGTTVSGLAFNDATVSSTETQIGVLVIVALILEFTIRSLVGQRRLQEVTLEKLRGFTGNVAHELRNPMTAMRSDLETTLRHPRSVEEMRATLQRVLTNTDRVIKISESLLVLARSDAGTPINAQETDLADLVEEASARWLPHAKTVGVELLTQVTPSGHFVGDPLLISQLLDNLIDNAVRYTPVHGQILIALQGSNETGHVLSVTDNGPGIPVSIRPTIFERFTRGSADDGGGHGAGLGLSLCAAIAQQHGGSIAIDNSFTAGTRIVVRLP